MIFVLKITIYVFLFKKLLSLEKAKYPSEGQSPSKDFFFEGLCPSL